MKANLGDAALERGVGLRHRGHQRRELCLIRARVRVRVRVRLRLRLRLRLRVRGLG